MAAVCSHKDEARKGVSTTAHAVAYMRSLESHLPPEKQLYQDPYAHLLGGEIGRAFIESRYEGGVAVALRLTNGMAVRTRRIDDEFMSSQLQQVCVFGAGLDTRAWRLKKVSSEPVHYFEVDFPEVFAFKLETLESAGALSEFEYHAVTADLSLEGWPSSLIAAGFDPSKPAFFILEGFINYLTEAEATAFFTAFSTSLAAKGSRLVMTCATPQTQTSTNMHKFFPENPLQFFNQFGWTGIQELAEDLAVTYNRPLDQDIGTMKGYYIITAELK